MHSNSSSLSASPDYKAHLAQTLFQKPQSKAISITTNAIKKRHVKMWTEKEDHRLLELHDKLGNNWIGIAAGIPERTPSQCIQRWRRKFQPMKTRKNWTNEEDKKLLHLVHEHGNNWKKISSFFNKTGKQIRERYINKLDPSIKRGPFSQQEDETIMQNLALFGTKWNLIAKNLPGRPQNAIKNRYYSHLKRLIGSIGFLKVEEAKTEEAEEAKEYEDLVEDEPRLKAEPFTEALPESYQENLKMPPDIKIEASQGSEEKIKKEEDPSRFWSEDIFLNKYIDFHS